MKEDEAEVRIYVEKEETRLGDSTYDGERW